MVQTALSTQVRMNWTTPQKHDASESAKISGFSSIVSEIRKWGTPCVRDSRGVGSKGSISQVHGLMKGHLDAQAAEHTAAESSGHRLNPDWAELLMGWPSGWTSTVPMTSRSFAGFPAGQGSIQHPHEPARTVHKDIGSDRRKRIAMIGNGVVPQQAAMAFKRLLKVA